MENSIIYHTFQYRILCNFDSSFFTHFPGTSDVVLLMHQIPVICSGKFRFERRKLCFSAGGSIRGTLHNLGSCSGKVEKRICNNELSG